MNKRTYNALRKVAGLWSWFSEDSQDDDKDELDVVYNKQSVSPPRHAVTDEGPVWYADVSIWDNSKESDDNYFGDTPKNTIKNLKGYAHKAVVGKLNKALKKYQEDNKHWLNPSPRGDLKLLGIKRSLEKSDDGSVYPGWYTLSVGDTADPDFRYDIVYGHELGVYPDKLTDIMPED